MDVLQRPPLDVVYSTCFDAPIGLTDQCDAVMGDAAGLVMSPPSGTPEAPRRPRPALIHPVRSLISHLTHIWADVT